jgi:hypothetical protein
MPHTKATLSVGNKYGRLTVLAIKSEPCRKAVAVCSCECGATKEVLLASLRRGRTQSCGCLHSQRTSQALKRHGLSKTAIYRCWGNMRTRCLNPKSDHYAEYGGRGITICDRWTGKGGFVNFLSDMGMPPHEGMEIERKNNDLGYGPENCRWATRVEQMHNTRRNRWFEYRGEQIILSDLARRLGVTPENLHTSIAKCGFELAIQRAEFCQLRRSRVGGLSG